MDRLEQSNYAVCSALAAPHLLYAFIWFFPRRWMAWFGKRSVKVFETVAWLLKGERDRGPIGTGVEQLRVWDEPMAAMDASGQHIALGPGGLSAAAHPPTAAARHAAPLPPLRFPALLLREHVLLLPPPPWGSPPCFACPPAVVQGLSVSYWYLLRRPSGIDLAAVPPAAWAAALLLVGFGQVCVRGGGLGQKLKGWGARR